MERGEDDGQQSRCIRKSGKSWRCDRIAMEGSTECEHHRSMSAVRNERRNQRRRFKRNPPDGLLDPTPLSQVPGGAHAVSGENGDAGTSIENATPILLPEGSYIVASEFPFHDLGEDESAPRLGRPQRSRKKPRLFMAGGEIPNTGNNGAELLAEPRNLQKRRRGRPRKYANGHCESERGVLEQGKANGITNLDANGSKKDQVAFCHHCLKSDGGIVFCSNCQRNCYCYTCIAKWYPERTTKEVENACPFCRGNCTCRACLQADLVAKAVSEGERAGEMRETNGQLPMVESHQILARISVLESQIVDLRSQIRSVTETVDLKLKLLKVDISEMIVTAVREALLADKEHRESGAVENKEAEGEEGDNEEEKGAEGVEGDAKERRQSGIGQWS